MRLYEVNALMAIIDGMNMTDLSKKMDITYSACSKFIYRLKKAGFIILNKRGRMNRIYLTPSGNIFKALIPGFMKFFEMIR